MAGSVTGAPFPQEMILTGVRGSVAYSLSPRHVEALMLERGVHVAHAPINRWGITYSPPREEAFHGRPRPVWVSWRMDEPDSKVQGAWYARERAVEKTGQPLDGLLTEPREEHAAKRFLTQAIRRHGVLEKLTIAGSAAQEAASKREHEEHGTTSAIRPRKHVHNVLEQAQRTVQRVTRPRLGLQAFDAAQNTLGGIDRRPMSKTRQLVMEAGAEGRTAAALFYSLAASSPTQTGATASA